MEYVPRLTDKEIEEARAHYEEKLATYRRKGLDFEEYRKFLLDQAEPLKGRILELGAGSGHTTVSLAKRGYEFTAIDTDEEALKGAVARLVHCKALSRVKFYIMNAMYLEFDKDSFNAILAINMLHHAADVEKLLSEADRVLCPKGKIIISDFNEDGQKIIDSVHREDGGAHDHPVTDQKQICSFFKDKGYKTEETESTGHWILVVEKR